MRKIRLVPELFDVTSRLERLIKRRSRKRPIGIATLAYPEHSPPTFPATWGHLCSRTPEPQLSWFHAPSRLGVPPKLEDIDCMYLLREEWGVSEVEQRLDYGCH